MVKSFYLYLAMQKQYLITFLFTFFGTYIFAQEHNTFCIDSVETFEQIQQQANTFFSNNTPSSLQNKEDNLYHKYKRWEWYASQRLNGKNTYGNVLDAYAVYKQNNKPNTNNKQTRANVWKNISQLVSDGGYNGMGRTTGIAFSKTDTNTYYVSTPKGGLWKTTDGGTTYAALGDALPTLACGDVVISATNANTLYIALNDRYSWASYTIGTYKSIDGGATWTPTGKTYNYGDGVTIYDLQGDLINGDILVAAQSDGLWRTIDGGATWQKVLNKNCNNVITHATNSAIWYAASYDYWGTSQVYKSIDNGATWQVLSNFSFAKNWIQLGTTPADTNYLGIVCDYPDTTAYLHSNNAGSTITVKNAYAPKCDAFTISAYNKNTIYFGQLDVNKSTDGGANFTRITKWYNNNIDPEVHADQRAVAINPLNNKIYWCNDGGIYAYTEPNNNWKELCNGLLVTQFYRIAVSQHDSIFIIGGTQDNGGRQRTALGNWASTNGGDAMEVAIVPNPDDIMFTTYVDGKMYKSIDKWDQDTYREITPNTNDYGSWVTPYTLHPTAPGIMVAGYTDVYYSEDYGENWNKISTNLAGPSNDDNLDEIAIAPSNKEYIYTSNNLRIHYTKNKGTTWAIRNIANSGGDFEKISSIEVHPKNENIVYFTRSGFDHNLQIMKSTDGAVSFKNISYNLPKLPANCMVIDAQSDSGNVDMYIGLEAGGVYYKKDKDTIWQYYGNGLPNTEVTSLKIQYFTGKLFCGTYGRGIWETTIARPMVAVSNTAIPAISKLSMQALYNGSQVQVSITSAAAFMGNYTLVNMVGQTVAYGAIDVKTGSTTFALPVHGLSKGLYVLALQNKHGVVAVSKVAL